MFPLANGYRNGKKIEPSKHVTRQHVYLATALYICKHVNSLTCLRVNLSTCKLVSS